MDHELMYEFGPGGTPKVPCPGARIAAARCVLEQRKHFVSPAWTLLLRRPIVAPLQRSA